MKVKVNKMDKKIYRVTADFYAGHIGEYTLLGTEGNRFIGVGNIPLVGLAIGSFNKNESEEFSISLHEFFNDNDTHENHISFISPTEDLLGKLVYVSVSDKIIYVTRLSKFLSPNVYSGINKILFPFELNSRTELKFEIK